MSREPSPEEMVTPVTSKKGKKKSNCLSNIKTFLKDMRKYILEFKFTKDFTQPKMQLFDETSDLVDFLNDFGYWMNVKYVAMKCRAFPLHLDGSSKDWFKSLIISIRFLSNPISSFDQLK